MQKKIGRSNNQVQSSIGYHCFTLSKAQSLFILFQAEEKCMIDMTKRQQQLDDNTAEMYNTLTSDLMTENPDVSQSNMGPGKKIAYSYKGMTESEKMQIRKEQLQQAEEARVRIFNLRQER